VGKIRVYELAKELSITSAALRAHLKEMGVDTVSASSSLDDTTAAAVRELLTQHIEQTPEEEAEEDQGLETVGLLPTATVRDFAQALDTDVENVLDELGRLGQPHVANQILSLDLAKQVGRGWGFRVIPQEKPAPPPVAAPPPPPAAKAPGKEKGKEKAKEKESEAAPTAAPRIVVIERDRKEREREEERIAERRLKPPPTTAPKLEELLEEAPPAEEEEIVPIVPVVWRPQVPDDAPSRPPVVTVMGHVDHGKTTLLDRIRKANVTASEAGGITQHIGAYQVEMAGRKITFIDTPGHEAFTAIRARGAQVTDIAILVVGADDGVKPQTLEAIDHAHAAEVPIVVAINKIDRPDANVERVRQQLLGAGLVSVSLGGDVEMVPVCATDGTGVETLLDTVLALADLKELKAAVDRPAAGTIIESFLDRRKGPVATVVVQEGILKVSQAVVAGLASGKIRQMTDEHGMPVREAGPSTPVSISGITPVPQAGNVFQVVENEKLARQIAEQRRLLQREAQFKTSTRASLSDIYRQIQSGEAKELNIILKADSQGSIDAIAQSLLSFQHPEVKLNLLHRAIGEITESDVLLAVASNGIVIGFQVGVDSLARRSVADEKVEIRLYQIIYDVIEDVRKALVGLLPVQKEEVVLGEAEVRALFRSSRMGTVAGCLVVSGKMVAGAQVRIRREGNVIFTGVLDSLRHVKEDVHEVSSGTECGIAIRSYSDYRAGDQIEAFEIQEIRRQVL